MKKPSAKSNRTEGLHPMKDLLDRFDWNKDKFVSQEFQLYGYKLAEDLGDMKHKSMYIKFAKEYPRPLLESARNFVNDARNAKSKARLFMWKLNELKGKK
jgi:hypothetical protein